MNAHLHDLTQQPWAIMWELGIALFLAFKMALLSSSSRFGSWDWHHTVFVFAWPGMNVDTFFSTHKRPPCRPSLGEWCLAFLRMSFGILLLVWISRCLTIVDPYVAGWVGMIGIVFTLHFGLFHVLSCVWRTIGLDTPPIMNHPTMSESLSEFWGRRWNLAFRDLTYRFLFRPLIKFWGPTASLVIGFLVSGLIHDLVISVPARGGYGYPTIYFLIQAAGLMFERSQVGRWLGLGRGWPGRIYCFAFLIIPCGLLFHSPFIHRVIIPFLATIGNMT